MVKKIHRKVEFLKFEKQCLCEDIQAIDRLGNRVRLVSVCFLYIARRLDIHYYHHHPVLW